VSLIVSCAWAALVAWLIMRAIAQRSAFQAVPDILPQKLEDAPNVSLVVPARNEAGNIGRCLASLAAQNYPNACLSVIVVDDHSEDGTLSIAASFAETYSYVQAIGCPALPQDWKGKPHACWIGAKAAPPEAKAFAAFTLGWAAVNVPCLVFYRWAQGAHCRAGRLVLRSRLRRPFLAFISPARAIFEFRCGTDLFFRSAIALEPFLRPTASSGDVAGGWSGRDGYIRHRGPLGSRPGGVIRRHLWPLVPRMA
jgi:cellulose synthase/poly-beta-1,6-N-acetylglucosamine synthase-like glycosyltransferase